jgi:hypothetical protein
MKEMLFKLRLFRYQIIWNYNSIATLLGTFILKRVTNYQHVTYIYTRNDKKENYDTVSKSGMTIGVFNCRSISRTKVLHYICATSFHLTHKCIFLILSYLFRLTPVISY